MIRCTRCAAVALGAALVGAASGAPINVLFPVTEVVLADDPGGSTRVETLGTPFGRAAPREADYVINGSSWRSGRLSNRVPRALVDLDLGAHGQDDAGLEREVALMFGRGFDQLEAGPDVFLLDSRGRATAMTVTPVFRTTNDTLVEGDAVLVSPGESYGAVEAGGLEIAGVGIDLDAWRIAGQAPEGAMLVGMVLRPADGGELAPMKIMLGEMLNPGDLMDRLPDGGSAGRNNLVYRGGARDQSGRLDDDRPDPVEIPSPSGALVIAAFCCGAGLRRRRADAVVDGRDG